MATRRPLCNVSGRPTEVPSGDTVDPSLIPTGAGIPAGSVFLVPGTTALPGTIKLNGATLSRTSYAALYAYAASSGLMAATEAGKTIAQFGPGNGSTTFSLPDYRGYFPRFWDDGKGTDSGRAIGGVQSAYAGNITAAISDRGFGSGTAYNAAIVLSMQGHTWGVTGIGNNSSATVDVTPGDSRPINIPLLACIKY